jgi:precorrin-6A/cobalt-precorrin-6A reductase
MASESKVLLLAGTGEAARLAAVLEGRADLRLTVSLAGATAAPRFASPCRRIGGFGGVDGLARWLREHGTDALIDATHPYAARMAANASSAAERVNVSRLKLWRPPWRAGPGDLWHDAADEAEAAGAARTLGRRPLVTLGGRGGTRFETVGFERVHVRAIEPLAGLTAPAAWVPGRPPFREDEERALMLALGIDVVVARNAGGTATRAKLDAARSLGLPVVLIRRPAPPPGPLVEDVEAVLAWLDQLPASRQT